MSSINDFYRLAKPGIVYGNLFHTLAGVLLALPATNWWLASSGALIGTGLLIASACVVNNLIDKSHDAKMERTRRRPLVTEAVSHQHAVAFAFLLAAGGFIVLIMATNLLTVLIGLIAYVLYAIVYTYSKRVTVHSTLIGTIPGALPAMAGYTAVSGTLDIAAWLIFALIAVWQLPHFYAITIFRRSDYMAAGWPVLSTRISFSAMRMVVIITAVLFWVTAAVFSAVLLHITAAIILLLGASYWMYVVLRGVSDGTVWSRSVFKASLKMSLILVVSLVVDFTIRYAL